MSDSPVRKELKKLSGHDDHEGATKVTTNVLQVRRALWIRGAPDCYRVCDPTTLQLDKVELIVSAGPGHALY